MVEMTGELHRLPKSPFDGVASSDEEMATHDSVSTATDIELGPQRTSSELRRVNSHGQCSQRKIKMKPIASMANLEAMDCGGLESPSRMTGLTITMKDLVYTVKSNKDRKVKIELLKNVSGWFSPGQMAALMGPSGSGKTTLLDVLAGRKTVGERTGEIRFGGVPPTRQFLRRYTGYVEQFDTLLGSLTVAEMLMYTAELKRPIQEDMGKKRDAVNALIVDLGLTTCSDTLIGSTMARGISGGQAKRCNIGIALITNPKVLFLDEPTSGLDSYTSNEVMTVVKRLVQLGITICATIHSPTPYCFRLFDRLILLLRGHVVYFGNRGECAIQYFKGLPSDIGVEEDLDNEAEWIVDITTQADRQGRASEFAEFFTRSAQHELNCMQLREMMNSKSDIDEKTLEALNTTQGTATPFWWALATLMWYRMFKDYRDPAYLGPRIGDKVIFSLLIMTLFWGVGDNMSSTNVINIAAVLFMWSTLPAFGAASYIPAIVLERPLFTRERSDGLYSVITYLCYKMISEMAITFVASIIFSCITFFPIQLQGSWVAFWLVYYCTLSCGIVLAYTIAAISPNMDVANAALPTYTVTLLFFSGFLIRFPDMPNYWKWYSYINFLSYAWSAQMVNQWEGHPDVLLNGEPVLEFYAIRSHGSNTTWGFLGIEFVFFVFFFFAAWAALHFCKHSKR